MADTLTKAQRSAHMAKIRSKRTKPEMLVHGHLKGLHVKHEMWPEMPGHPDILIGESIAVFVNGCFWHGCPRHFRCPKTNADFWTHKIARNRERQEEVLSMFKEAGYQVAVLWEHELTREGAPRIMKRLAKRHG